MSHARLTSGQAKMDLVLNGPLDVCGFWGEGGRGVTQFECVGIGTFFTHLLHFESIDS